MVFTASLLLVSFKFIALPYEQYILTRLIGTTGKPKGVDVLHRNACNLLTLSPGNVGMAPGRKVAQLLSVSFDMGQWEMLGAMMNGATLVLRTSDNWTSVLSEVSDQPLNWRISMMRHSTIREELSEY